MLILNTCTAHYKCYDYSDIFLAHNEIPVKFYSYLMHMQVYLWVFQNPKHLYTQSRGVMTFTLFSMKFTTVFALSTTSPEILAMFPPLYIHPINSNIGECDIHALFLPIHERWFSAISST